MEYTDFCDDAEKMVDFFQLSKEEFLKSYSYMTEEEWLSTALKMMARATTEKEYLLTALKMK
jgi:hypothetical protein